MARLDLVPKPILKPDFQPTSQGGGTIALANILTMVLAFITLLAGLWFAVQFILAGWQWLTAGSDSGKVAEAQKKIINSFTGLIIVVAAITIIRIISLITGIEILNLQLAIQKISP